MKKAILVFGILSASVLCNVSAAVSNEAAPEIAATSSCGEGQTRVSWSIDCPDGNYSGSICIGSQYALEAAKQIMSAECP